MNIARFLTPCLLMGLFVTPVMGSASTVAADPQEAAIRDSQAWAAGIIQGLGTLAPPPSAVPASAPVGRPRSAPRRKESQAAPEAAAAAPSAPASEIKNYEYRQKGRYTEVIIKIRDKFENGVSRSFKVTVTSTQPLSGWTIRLKGEDTVLAQGGLFGDTSFSKLVARPYRPDYVMNLSVKRDGSDWVDFFKLYNEGTVQSK